jgi:uncharacterized protein (TIGR03437 family)
MKQVIILTWCLLVLCLKGFGQNTVVITPLNLPAGQNALTAAPDGRLWSAGSSLLMETNPGSGSFQTLSALPSTMAAKTKSIHGYGLEQDSFFPKNGTTSVFGLGTTSSTNKLSTTQDFEWSASPSGLVQVCKTYTINGTSKLDPIRSGPYFGSDGAAYYYGTTVDANGKMSGSTIYLRQTPNGTCNLVSKDISNRSLVQIWEQSNGSFLVERIVNSDPINWATTEIGLISGGVFTAIVSPDPDTHPAILATACCDMVWDLSNQSALVTYRDSTGGHAFLYKNGKIVPVYDNDGRAGANIRALALNGQWSVIGVSTSSPFTMGEGLLVGTANGKVISFAKTGDTLPGGVKCIGVGIGVTAVGPDGTVSFAGGSGPGNNNLIYFSASILGPPEVVSFAPAKPTIVVGDSVPLSWKATNTDKVSIQGLGLPNGQVAVTNLPASGSIDVSPKQRTTYILTATGPMGFVVTQTTLDVTSAAILPTIASGGVRNAADSTSVLIAPGTLATVFGSNLCSGTASNSSLPLPTTLSGCSVMVNGNSAPLTYVGGGQINFLVPNDVKSGSGTVQVVRDGTSGNKMPTTFTATAPAVFLNGSLGILTDATATTVILVDNNTPMIPGKYYSIWATGLGAKLASCTPAVGEAPHQACSALANITLTVGGVPAQVIYAGAQPDFPGLDQVNFLAPENSSSSLQVQGVLTVGNVSTTFTTVLQAQ